MSKRRPNSLISRLRKGIEAGIELSVPEWGEQLLASENQIYVLLSSLRKDGVHAYPVTRDNGKKVVVQLNRETRDDEEADEFARLSDSVHIRYSRDINARLDNVLRAMEDCTALYPMLESSVKERLLITAQQIIQYDYEQFTKLLDGYRENHELPEGRPEPTADES